MNANPEWDYLHKRRFDIRLRALSNRMYQQERARIMEVREGLVKAASLIAGSVAIANVAKPDVVQMASAVVFGGTALSLVLGWGAKARDASKRASEWALLERDIESAGERTFVETQLDIWAARCNEIEASEPAANKGMFENCYRRACEALGSKAPPGGPFLARFRIPLIVP